MLKKGVQHYSGKEGGTTLVWQREECSNRVVKGGVLHSNGKGRRGYKTRVVNGVQDSSGTEKGVQHSSRKNKRHEYTPRVCTKLSDVFTGTTV